MRQEQMCDNEVWVAEKHSILEKLSLSIEVYLTDFSEYIEHHIRQIEQVRDN